MPKVSVLMPCYKTSENFLREAIESILNQTFTDFEYIITDNCPEDSREDIVKSYNDPRIRYIKNEKNIGITANRNKLMDLAKGEYLAIFDHDDISLPDRLEKEVKFLDEHPNVGVVSSLVRMIPKQNILRHPEFDADIRTKMIQNCAIAHTASMVRKDVVDKHHIRYDVVFTPAEDYKFFCDLMAVTECYNIPEPLTLYRQHGSNLSKLQAKRMEMATNHIRAIMQEKHPVLYQAYLIRARKITYHVLFGCLPFLKIVSTNNKVNYYLFNKILLWQTRHKRVLDVEYSEKP